MQALEGAADGAPPPPPGVQQRRITFADTREQPRREWFLAGTALTQVAAAPAESRRPRITSPVAGSGYARDPDIPAARQRLAVMVSGSTTAHRLWLDTRELGSAETPPPIAIGPGRHVLTLIDTAGRTVDRVAFTMR